MEKQHSSLVTTTDPKYYFRQTLLITSLAAIGSGLCSGIYTRLPLVGLAACALVLFVCAFMVIPMRNKPITLRFVGAKLYISLANGNDVEVHDIPASAFICKQTAAQQKENVGDIKIKGTSFHFYGVRDYSSVCEYIKDHFPA